VVIYVDVVSFTYVGLKHLRGDQFLELDVTDRVMLMSGCDIVLYRELPSCAYRIVTSVQRTFFWQ
jgi:hypothetical protein